MVQMLNRRVLLIAAFIMVQRFYYMARRVSFNGFMVTMLPGLSVSIQQPRFGVPTLFPSQGLLLLLSVKGVVVLPGHFGGSPLSPRNW